MRFFSKKKTFVVKSGQTLILTAVLLLFVGVPIWAFGTDEGQMQIDYVKISDAALMAAKNGASTISVSNLNNATNYFTLVAGEQEIPGSSAYYCDHSAQQGLNDVLPGISSTINCTTSGNDLTETITITATIPLIIPFPIHNVIKTTQTATLVVGCTRPISDGGGC